MKLLPIAITKDQLVKDIVVRDYRAALVFEKFGISYCCGGNWPLETACLTKGIEAEQIISELQKITRNIQVSSSLPFEKWNMDFLTDYIINVHHHYLKQTLPDISELLTRFAGKHADRYTFLFEVLRHFSLLFEHLLQEMEHEETITFPYIRHLNHAFESNDSYAALLVKTLRKPVPKMLAIETGLVAGTLQTLRQLTNNYTVPEKACTSHHVVYSKLAELDNDLTQHMFLENDILYPKVLTTEKDLLSRLA